MLNKYIIKSGKKLRYGYTTGSCAAGAAKAAAEMLLTRTEVKEVVIDTPKGWPLTLAVEDIEINKNYAKCSVVKDAGDDPDNTHGIKIFAKIFFNDDGIITVTAGEGIGIAARKGLLLDVGQPAINPVPRRMIIDEVKKVMPAGRGVIIEISAPEGKEIAKKTFNPKLGIEGGISILGTSGIVEPMSNEAMMESLALNISVLKEAGEESLVFVPGKYGRDFASRDLKIPSGKIVLTSNYIGYMLEQAVYYKMKKVLLIGHIGKLIKLAGGIFNTHSRIADSRLEIMAAHYGNIYGSIEIVKKIMNCANTEEAIDHIAEKDFFNYLACRAAQKCNEYAGGALAVEAILFSLRVGFLGQSGGAGQMLKQLRQTK